MDWLRLYVDILDDPKIKRMSDKTFKIFIFLLLFARELDGDGVIHRTTCDVAWRIRISETSLMAALEDLVSLNVVSYNSEQIQFLNWQKRQYKSDDVTERVQRYRKRFSNVTSNVIDTDTEQIQNRTEDIAAQVPFEEIIDYLNTRSGKKFRSSGAATKRHIVARWNEGFRVDDFQRVIDNKCGQWLDDKKMSEYLRPETLFGTKFESYLNSEAEKKEHWER